MNKSNQEKDELHEKLVKIQDNMALLKNFIPAAQISVITDLMRGEEQDFFIDKLSDLIDRIEGMPKVYEQDGKPAEEVLVYLHYFTGSCDWYITEKDLSQEQHQAFGYSDMGSPELRYIPISELVEIDSVEIDLHFDPISLAEVKKQVSEKYSPTRKPKV